MAAGSILVVDGIRLGVDVWLELGPVKRFRVAGKLDKDPDTVGAFRVKSDSEVESTVTGTGIGAFSEQLESTLLSSR